MKLPYILFSSLLLFLIFESNAQPTLTAENNAKLESETVVPVMALYDLLHFALHNQPNLKQSLIDEAVADLNIKLALANWLPQINASANYQNFFQLPTSFSTINGNMVGVKSGVYNYSIPQLSISQNIFSNDALFASKISKLSKEQSLHSTQNTKINLISTVSKAYYDLLLSLEQIAVLREDTARLTKNQADAYHRFVSGIVDKVDYKQASIALNNSKSKLKSAVEIIEAKKAFLRQITGFPIDKNFTVKFDTGTMLQEIFVDTLAELLYEKRIEFKQLLLAKKVQQENTLYYKSGYLPTVSVFYNYFYEFENNRFSDLYGQAFPYSLLGLQLNFSIFSGMKRVDNIRKSKLIEERVDYDITNLKLLIHTQYQQALSNYKSNLYNFRNLLDNKEMAKEVYNIVKLQYREGVKTYLDVIVAESDLQTSEINYLNALLQVLESKIDLEQAMGNIPTEL